MESGAVRVCPDDGKEYTFSELVCAFEDASTLESLSAKWKKMVPLTGKGDPSPDEDEAQLCGAIVHFRRDIRGSGVPELFGLPLVLCVQRSVTARGLSEAVGR